MVVGVGGAAYKLLLTSFGCSGLLLVLPGGVLKGEFPSFAAVAVAAAGLTDSDDSGRFGGRDGFGGGGFGFSTFAATGAVSIRERGDGSRRRGGSGTTGVPGVLRLYPLSSPVICGETFFSGRCGGIGGGPPCLWNREGDVGLLGGFVMSRGESGPAFR